MIKPPTPSPAETTRLHFFELLRKFDTATLVTHTQAGSLHGRPLAVAGRESDGTLWFTTSIGSAKVAEIAADSRVLVAMQSSNQFIVLQGPAEIVRDRTKVDELWSEVNRVWFEGKDDPDIVLLRFSPLEAEFWDNAGAQGIKFAFAAVKALVQGEPLRDLEDPKAHGKLAL